MSDMEHERLKGDTTESDDGNAIRMEILSLIESGEIDVEEGLKRLEDIESEVAQEGVLGQLETGEIDVSEAIRIIESERIYGSDATQASEDFEIPSFSPSTEEFRSWWLLIPGIGFGITAFGGWLGTFGGWWWVCAAPSLILGIFVLLFALVTQNSPWLHVRIDTGHETWPRRIALSFPVPVRIVSWGLRRWGHYARGLDATAVDELLLSLEGNLSEENPIHIEIHDDDESGERIQVFLG